jgi:hypothetical protein
LIIVWLFISLTGFLAFFTVDELGTRTRRIDEPIVAFFCGSGFIAAVLSLVGGQLALANSERNSAE